MYKITDLELSKIPFGSTTKDLTDTYANFLFSEIRGIDPVLGGGKFSLALSKVADVAGVVVSSITVVNKIATITTATAHDLLVGAIINLNGFLPADWNRIFYVEAITSATVFTVKLEQNYTVPTTIGSYVSGAIIAGQLVQFDAINENGIRKFSIKPSIGAANSGKNLGVATTSCFKDFYSYIQVQGIAEVHVSGGATLNAAVYALTNGRASITPAAGKQVIGAEFVSVDGELIKFTTENNTQTSLQLKANKALCYINRAKMQTQII
jgi:hypothetical protein